MCIRDRCWILRREPDDDARLAVAFGQVRVKLATYRDHAGAARNVLIGSRSERKKREHAEHARAARVQFHGGLLCQAAQWYVRGALA